MDFSGLICERKGVVSIGRILLWITFLIMIAWWLKLGVQDVELSLGALTFKNTSALTDVPKSLQDVFTTLILYNLFKKARDVASNFLMKDKKEGKNELLQD